MTTKAAIKKQYRLPVTSDTCPSVSDPTAKNGRCMSTDDDKADSIRWKLVDYIRSEIARDRYETKVKLETAIERMIASGQRGIVRL